MAFCPYVTGRGRRPKIPFSQVAVKENGSELNAYLHVLNTFRNVMSSDFTLDNTKYATNMQNNHFRFGTESTYILLLQ